MIRILIIGGTGFISHHVVRAAVEKGWHVSSLSKNSPLLGRFVNGVNYLQGDLLNESELKYILHDKEFEYVVNLGGYINHTSFQSGGREHIDEHFNAIQNLVTLIPRTKLKKFIQIGSSDEYGNSKAPQHENLRESPISPYSLGKVAATHFLQMLHKTENFPVIILRLFLTFGPGQNHYRFLPQVIKGCLNNEKFPTSAGEQIRDFCYVEDIVRAVFLALSNDKLNGEVFNIATGEPVSIRAMIENVQDIIGKGKPCFGEVPYRMGENMNLFADIKKSKKFLGWSPSINLKSALIKTISWYSDND